MTRLILLEYDSFDSSSMTRLILLDMTRLILLEYDSFDSSRYDSFDSLRE